MRYIDYINLGFKRCDINDVVEVENTGYSGFYLSKRVSKHATVFVSYGSLDKPKLYIDRPGRDECHIVPLEVGTVMDLCRM